jgi:CheY-like chemotaxis protein
MALKAERKNLPVIAVSGLNADSSLYLHMAKKLGARRTLPKPFTLEQLTSLVNEVLAEAKGS